MFTARSFSSVYRSVWLRSALLFLAFASALAGAQPSSAASAATITVQSGGDGPANTAHCPGANCTLRDAIAKANPGDTITFNFLGTVKLTQGELTINKSLNITVGGICDIFVDAQTTSRAFKISAGGTVNITNLCIENGKTTASGESGGGMLASGGATVNLDSVHFLTNRVEGTTSAGGAIENDAVMTISNFAFFGDNYAHTNGGAIANTGSLTLNGVLTSSGNRSIAFFSNSTSGQGGGIYNEGTLTIVLSSFQLSSGINGAGALTNYHGTVAITGTVFAESTGLQPGGIENYPASTMGIADSTIDGSTATNSAGGIENQGTLTIVRSTISGNGADNGVGGGLSNTGDLTAINVSISGNGASTFGGGLYTDSAENVILNNVTITRNTADDSSAGTGNGGGIRVASGVVDIRNSIVGTNFDTADNGGPGAVHPDCSGTLHSQGYNILGINTGCSGLTNGVGGDQVGTSGTPLSPLLHVLADNGGLTPTHALLLNSPAKDKGNPAMPGSGGLACAIHDQRDLPRGGGAGTCDIGAFEQVFLQFLPVILK